MDFIFRHFLILGISIISVVSLVLYYDDIKNQGSLFVANIQEDMSYYRGESEEIQRYNEAIFVARRGDYLAAESLLSPLINMKTLTASGEIYELYGDVLYSLNRPYDVILPYYSRSLDFNCSNLRVEKKITLLSQTLKSNSGSEDTQTQSGKADVPQFNSGMIEKNEKLNELNSFSEKRGEYMRYDATTETDKEFLIRSSLDSLQGKKEERDW